MQRTVQCMHVRSWVGSASEPKLSTLFDRKVSTVHIGVNSTFCTGQVSTVASKLHANTGQSQAWGTPTGAGIWVDEGGVYPCKRGQCTACTKMRAKRNIYEGVIVYSGGYVYTPAYGVYACTGVAASSQLVEVQGGGRRNPRLRGGERPS